MKRYISIILFTISISPGFSQPYFVTNDTLQNKERVHALKSVLSESKYIIEALPVGGSLYADELDYYYVPEENQSYFVTLIKVTKIFKGDSISLGDTLVGVFKQFLKGKGKKILSGSNSFRLWYYFNTQSCLFLSDNVYPITQNGNQWSSYKKVSYVNSKVGYIAASYNAGIPAYQDPIAVYINGLIFNSQSDWYNFLKQYPDIKVPEKF